jgi:hypothetical protein
MVPEDLLFWVDRFHAGDGHDTGVLCRRHADAMVVPRGWTLDDRREPQPRLFRSPPDASGAIGRPTRRRSPAATGGPVEQLELADTHTEIDNDTDNDTDNDNDNELHIDTGTGDPALAWAPIFDAADDLDGLLHVDSPLLARAFRGRAR